MLFIIITQLNGFNLGVMATKKYSTFPKASRVEPRHQLQFSIISRTRLGVGPYPSAEMQSVYSTADWVVLYEEFTAWISLICKSALSKDEVKSEVCMEESNVDPLLLETCSKIKQIQNGHVKKKKEKKKRNEKTLNECSIRRERERHHCGIDMEQCPTNIWREVGWGVFINLLAFDYLHMRYWICAHLDMTIGR